MKVIFSGRITKDPELKHLQSGKSVLNVNIATDFGFGDRKETEFVQVAIWGKQGEALSQYLKKGDMHTWYCDFAGISAFLRRDNSAGAQMKLTLDSVDLIPGGGRVGGVDAQAAPATMPVDEPPF